MQNLKVFCVWLLLVIIPRQLDVYFGWGGEMTDGSDVGWIMPNAQRANEYRCNAMGCNTTIDAATNESVYRDWDIHMHSAYAPAIGSNQYYRHFTAAYFFCVVIIYAITIRR
jgi:hypothetical protein